MAGYEDRPRRQLTACPSLVPPLCPALTPPPVHSHSLPLSSPSLPTLAARSLPLPQRPPTQALVPVHEQPKSSLLRDYCKKYKRQASASGAMKRTTTVPLYSVCRCHEGEGPVLQSKARPPVNGNNVGIGFQVVSLPAAEASALQAYADRHATRPCDGCGAAQSLYWWSAADVAEACAEIAAELTGAAAPPLPPPTTVADLGGDAAHFCHACYWKHRDAYADRVDGAGTGEAANAMAVDA